MRARSAVTWSVAALAAGISLVGCSGVDPNAKILSEAVYANNVPVYKGAQFDESMGNESWGDEPGSYTRGMTWWFKTKASKSELLAYYEKLYPNAEKLELDGGAVQLRWVPEGATRFEDVTIVMDDQELRIGESVTPEARDRMRNGGAAAASSGGSSVESGSDDHSGE